MVRLRATVESNQSSHVTIPVLECNICSTCSVSQYWVIRPTPLQLTIVMSSPGIVGFLGMLIRGCFIPLLTLRALHPARSSLGLCSIMKHAI
jgi:hypothetical protein